MDNIKRIGESLPGFTIALLPLIVEFFGKSIFERTVTQDVEFAGLNDRRRVICNFEYFTTVVSICIGMVTLAIVIASSQKHEAYVYTVTVICFCIAFLVLIILIDKGTHFFAEHESFVLCTGLIALLLKVWEFVIEKRWL